MRAGGKMTGTLWTTRVHSLRPGDHVKVANWSGECWVGGEALVVQSEPTRLPRTIDRPAGYFDVAVHVPYDKSEWRVLCMLGDDQVQLVARDAVREEPVVGKSKKIKKSKPAPQLKLFDD